MAIDPEEYPEEYAERLMWMAWYERVKAISQGAHSWNFQIGDLLNEGAQEFDGKKMYAAAAELTGLPRYHLYELASVAAAVPVSLRNEKLSWSHHRAVSKLPPDQQSRWLKEAENGDLKVRELRTAIKVRKFSSPATAKAEVIAKPEAITPAWDAKRKAFILLYGEQEKRLEKLLKVKCKSIDSYVTHLVHADLATLETAAAIEEDAALRKLLAEKARVKGWAAYVQKTRRSIEVLLEELEQHADSSGVIECSVVVQSWERRHGKRFPYKLAQTFSAWTDRYAGLSAEDCACEEFSTFG